MNIKPFILLASLGLMASCETKKDEGDGMDSTAVATNSLEQLWSTDSIIRTPESVLLDKANDILYVAQIDGEGGEKDGKGGVGKLGTDGKVIDLDWVTGLNAPKGMAMHNGKLFVADLTEMVEIDMATGKVLRKIPVEGSEFLNDVTVDANGDVFVSDSNTKQITMIKDGKSHQVLRIPHSTQRITGSE